jgi:hypothetical protein
MCLTPRVSSFDMPTEFDRIWDIEKTERKKEFNKESIAISPPEIFCLCKGIKTNRDIINFVMEDIFELSERDDFDDNMYLNLTKNLKKRYEECEKKNILDIPISFEVINDNNISIHILISTAMEVRNFDINPNDEKLQELVRLYIKDKFKEKSNQEFTTINKKKKKNKKK